MKIKASHIISAALSVAAMALAVVRGIINPGETIKAFRRILAAASFVRSCPIPMMAYGRRRLIAEKPWAFGTQCGRRLLTQ